MADFTKLNGYTVKDPNAVHTYDTVADLKADTKLKAGNHAQTKGYTTTGDDGHATYIIVDDNTLVDNGGSVHELSNGLFAVLLIENEINVKQFGAYGDGVHDDTDAIQKALDVSNNVYIPDGTYLINAEATSKFDNTAGLVVKSNTDIKISKDAILKVIPNSVEWYSVFMLYHVENIKITGGKIIGDRDDHTYSSGTHEWGAGIKCINAKDVTIRDITINDCTGDGIEIGNFTGGEFNRNITIDNCTIDNVRRNGISIEVGDNFKIINTNITDVNGIAPQFGVDLEPNNVVNDELTNILFDGCYISNCTGGGINCWRADNVKVVNSYISVPNEKVPVGVIASNDTNEVNKNIIVENNIFDSTGTGWYMIGSNTITKGNQFNNTNIYLTYSSVLNLENSIFDGNTIKDGLMKTALGGGVYTVACNSVKISNNIFSYTLSGEDVDPTGDALNNLQFEFGTRDATGGKKISGIKIDSNIFEYTNTGIFTTPGALISNKTSFDLGLIDSEFTNNTVKNMPYGMLCSKLPKVKFTGNKLYNVGFLWAYRGVSVQNESTSLFNFDNNVFEYDTTTPPSQVVYIQGMNHIVNNTLHSTTTIPDCFLKLQDGAVSYVYNNFATSSTTNGVISCYTNPSSLHGDNNES